MSIFAGIYYDENESAFDFTHFILWHSSAIIDTYKVSTISLLNFNKFYEKYQCCQCIFVSVNFRGYINMWKRKYVWFYTFFIMTSFRKYWHIQRYFLYNTKHHTNQNKLHIYLYTLSLFVVLLIVLFTLFVLYLFLFLFR